MNMIMALNDYVLLIANVQAEEERIRKEEQEKREHEEYLKMKEMFSVDEEGESEQTGDLDVRIHIDMYSTVVNKL